MATRPRCLQVRACWHSCSRSRFHHQETNSQVGTVTPLPGILRDNVGSIALGFLCQYMRSLPLLLACRGVLLVMMVVIVVVVVVVVVVIVCCSTAV